MNKAYVLLADGFEEIEGLMCVDLLRRAGIETVMFSISDSLSVKGARGIEVKADKLIKDIDDSASIIILPGGMPGTTNLKNSQEVRDVVMKYYESDKYVAAICAAPTVLGDLGLLRGKKATCYPGLELGLVDAIWPGEKYSVVVDGKIITSRGLGTAIDFALKIIELLISKEKADGIKTSVVYER
ncbi:MAG: DJ-1/PfpI family protein [Eubacterium sp.]|nr:DJ-1/PfpI family protein [Eubacterium sp.]